jgi:hypothetical protein
MIDVTRLTRQQRKAIRRMGRGQSISNSQIDDPLIQELTAPDHHPELPENYNVADYCDWVAHMHSVRPRLNSLGMKVLQDLGQGDPK